MKLKASAVQRVVIGPVAIVTIRTSRFGDLVFRTPRNARGVTATWRQVINAARSVERA
jgi:hypothetical protein